MKNPLHKSQLNFIAAGVAAAAATINIAQQDFIGSVVFLALFTVCTITAVIQRIRQPKRSRLAVLSGK